MHCFERATFELHRSDCVCCCCPMSHPEPEMNGWTSLIGQRRFRWRMRGRINGYDWSKRQGKCFLLQNMFHNTGMLTFCSHADSDKSAKTVLHIAKSSWVLVIEINWLQDHLPWKRTSWTMYRQWKLSWESAWYLDNWFFSNQHFWANNNEGGEVLAIERE